MAINDNTWANTWSTIAVSGSSVSTDSFTILINGQPVSCASGITVTLPPIADPTEHCIGGHDVREWAEYPDGVIAGLCVFCTQRVTTERIPGGVPVMRLNNLVELLLADDSDLVAFLELKECADLLDAEERALTEAKALLATARRMAAGAENGD